MEKKTKEADKSSELVKEVLTKKPYLSPTLDVTRVEMEYGIAAGSAPVSPVSVNGNVDQIQTDWENDDNQTVTAPF
ncbi:hypothetical protein CMU59_17600 [Elizabethkingia anophelis]|uniref:hypothetical protein n=1 Tax=Elizabethkingia anophelis TaxID=1117645 RepID=UPI0021A93215|nr:hypothetical protein [Elizabethkingia anophelis]MCT3947629.1 hypothetical protein [Elizabethkingia anophelis]MDV3576186.1 hypothetical protein [Elizabethkingia anophelis]MDV3601347.1 hypothetical protein [Elizabethkingia anophelis]MDV3608588.1 hypothetical protein [Elizabethkingia anophelis]